MTEASGKAAIKEWWTTNPMTYGQVHGRPEYEEGVVEPGSLEFFEQVDRKFYAWNAPLHDDRPFGRLFPYEDYVGGKVLEVGCGMGTMAMNWARNGTNITAVDLNPASVTLTTDRFNLVGLSGEICLADARRLPFSDTAFDYVYSWGVIHHSPDIERSVSEIVRVLKPGGRFGIMVYNRKSLLHRYMTEYVEGFLHYENQFLGPLALASRYGDGQRAEGNPYTWPMTMSETQDLLAAHNIEARVKKLGTELDSVLRLMLPGLGLILPVWVKKSWARRFGWSLWVYGSKPS